MVSNGNCVEPASRDLEIAPTRVGISVRLETAPTGEEQFQVALSIIYLVLGEIALYSQ